MSAKKSRKEISWREFGRREMEMIRFLQPFESGAYGVAVRRYLRTMQRTGYKFLTEVFEESWTSKNEK